MTHKQILTKAVKVAISNGWTVGDWTDADDFTWNIETGEYDELLMHYTGLGDDWYLNVPAIVFDHSFAIALWGDGWAWFTKGQSGDTLPSSNYINWIGHIANMVVADDAIAYLGQNI